MARSAKKKAESVVAVVEEEAPHAPAAGPVFMTLDIDAIVTDEAKVDGIVQMRPDRDPVREAMFMELYLEGAEIDRIEVWDTPEGYLITNGWTRFYGRRSAQFPTIDVALWTGSVQDATRAAALANRKGEKPRCEITIRNALFAICELDGPDQPIPHYVRACGVSYNTAKKYVDRYREVNKLPAPSTRASKNGKNYPTTYPKPSDKPEVAEPPNNFSREKLGGGHGTPEVVESLDAIDPSRIPLVGEDVPDDADTVVIKPKVDEKPRKAVDPEKVIEQRRLEDLKWLKSLKRDNGETPIREALPEHQVPAFDAMALQYRDFIQGDTHKAWKREAESVFGFERGQGKGPIASMIGSILNVKHPKDWYICSKCKGTGRVGAANCPQCRDGCGFKVK